MAGPNGPKANKEPDRKASDGQDRKKKKASDFVVSQNNQIIEHLAEGPDNIRDDGATD